MKKVNGKKLNKNLKMTKQLTILASSLIRDVIYHKVYIINFSVNFNEDLLRLICENTSKYMNKAKPLFQTEIGASEKSDDISKIQDKTNYHVLKAK